MFADSHAHLTCEEIYSNVEEVLKRAKLNGIEIIINICTDAFSLEKGIEIAQKYPWVFNTGATTPHDVEKRGDMDFFLFEKAAKEGKLVGIGETGLDYYYEHSSKEQQKKFLKKYFSLALDCHLPLVVHCRDAFHDLFSLADSHFTSNGKSGKAVLHCFTGNYEEAKRALDRGWYISFSGIITFKKSDSLREVAKQIPLSKMFIETDAPYLAPQSKRGKMNEPSYIGETAQTIASLKMIEKEAVAKQTMQNVMDFFHLYQT